MDFFNRKVNEYYDSLIEEVPNIGDVCNIVGKFQMMM